ncbi:hypothetical protein GCM10009127_13110 [Alteraurantiacibacter aestuarii]|uniref:Transglycosylase SLT domain-containing protein n=1 Tax=Alteraurantiacibacter aestuarii TaxID=650004 RepID=A0A844ZM22_9SPHN|nr:hypothetical protein [Alteraurantiacibacter aestuarii]MXO88100.1 hypothetical protein [Alteraurantiacibacter aestuarii]
MANELPISRKQAIKATEWLIEHFRSPMEQAVVGKPYRLKHLCAIACQETAYRWVGWIDHHDPATILARCVFDASGDAPNSSRGVRPVNAAAFRADFGDEFAQLLIDEANKYRRLMNWSARDWLYKGYGIFQYDLQYCYTDPDFFRERKWYDFGNCLAKVTGELDEKLKAQNGDLWEAIRAYNGSGPRARAYRENVKEFTPICAEVTGDDQP